MDVLKIGSLNINGGRDKNKVALVSEFLKTKKINVSFLQETHSDYDNEIVWRMWWKGHYVMSHGISNSAGVAILFSNDMNMNIIKVEEFVKGRLLLVQIECEGVIFVLVNVYAPNNGSERITFFTKLMSVVEKYDDSVCLIFGGDWNCTIDFTVDRNGEEPHNQSSALLSKVIKDFQLTDVWRIRNEGVKQYTWMKVSDNIVSGARLD